MKRTNDEQWMRKALQLARRGRGRTSPNPMVGAVLVSAGQALGSGWHRQAGSAHAEVLALSEAGAGARGATLFVTLEPCSHEGRTPPCAQALIKAKVARVVVAMADPDPRVSGAGIKTLREAGIDVEVGVSEPEARKLNEAYIVHRTEHRPFVTYKVASTMDGRTSAQDGSSKWITGPGARRDVQRLRSRTDAICVGSATVLRDDPSLTVRHGRAKHHPARVVVDTQARTPRAAAILSGPAPTLIFTGAKPLSERVGALEEAGAQVIATSGTSEVLLTELLAILAERGVLTLLLEGGPTLARSFAGQGLIDRFIFYVAPKLLGEGGKGILEGWAAQSINDAAALELGSVKKIGGDLKVEAYPAVRNRPFALRAGSSLAFAGPDLSSGDKLQPAGR